MPSLKKLSAQLLGFATVLVLALGLGAAPASAAVDIVIDGVGYVINGSGEAVVSMYTSDLPADLSIPSSVILAGSTYPVTQIGGAVFSYANALVAVTIPASVTSIGRQAFAFDSALTSIRFLGASPSIAPEALSGVVSTVYFFSRFGADAVNGGFTTPTWHGLNTDAVDETLTLTPKPSITGSASVGDTLTAVTGDWDSGVDFGYQWKRNGFEISGATSSSYTLTADDMGTAIVVTVVGSKPYFASQAKTSRSVRVPFLNTTINGVGYTIDGAGAAYVSGINSDIPADLSLESSVNIAGVDYAVTGMSAFGLYSTPILTSVTIPDSFTSVANVAFALDPALTSVTIGNSVTHIGSIAFHNDAALASVIFRGAAPTVEPDSFMNANPTVYFFSRFGADAVDGGFTTPTWHGLNTVSVDEKFTLTPTPVISGVAIVGEVLSVDSGEWDSGVSLTYQWNRDGVAIDGETGLTYGLTGVDGGSVISVTVMASKPYFLGIASISEATGVVQRQVVYDIDHVKRHLSQLKPTITGWSKAGHSLRVATDKWSRSRNLHFQWFANGKRIAGATARSYTLQAGQVGARVSVRVIWRKSPSSVIARTTVKKARVAKK